MSALRVGVIGVLAALLAALLVLPGGGAGAATGADQLDFSVEFTSASNLFVGSQVRVLGLPVGTVTNITPAGPVVIVELAVNDTPLPADVRANLVPISLLGERVIQLDPPYTGGAQLSDGAVIATDRTRTPAEVDEVLASFSDFLTGLDGDALAQLVNSLGETLDGQGAGVNQLIDRGATTVRILRDASGDLNGVVNELATLNTALATRDERIGQTLEQFSTLLRTLIDEKGDIVGAVANLRRLLVELRPLLDSQTEPLIRDLETLATTLSTMDRNLDRVGDVITNGRSLFEDFGPNFADFRNGFFKLDNEGQELGDALERRLEQRLAGLCVRLGLGECATSAYWAPVVPALVCLEGVSLCASTQAGLAQALATALDSLPASAREQLAAEARDRRMNPPAAPDGVTAPPTAPRAPAPAPAPLLPLPDPRLQELDDIQAPPGIIPEVGR